MLTHANLKPDPILQRKIARIQAAEARAAAEEPSDEEEPRGAQEITSSSPVHTPRSSRIVRMKRERVSGVPQSERREEMDVDD